MPTFRKITMAEYEQDPNQKHTTDDKRTGRVTVYYSNGMNQEFEHINRGQFYEWESAGLHWNRPPDGVHCMAPEIEPEPEDIQSELDAQAEEDEIAYNARREKRRALFMAANLALEKRIGKEEYRKKWGVPPSERMEWEAEQAKRKKPASRFSLDNPKWKWINEQVKQKIGEAEYNRRYGNTR